MTGIMFLYNNLLDAAILTASSAATGFPASNLQNPFRSKVWRTAGATAGTASVIIDHATAKAVTCVALIGYNWASAPGTLNFDMDAAATFDSGAGGAPEFSQALTWAANPTANGNPGIIVKTFASLSKRYNRLNVVYSPGATPTDWDLGRIFVGTYFEPALSYKRSHRVDIADPSYVLTTIGGQDHVDEVTKYRVRDFRCMAKTRAQWESFMAMINHVGKRKDLIIAFDYDNEPAEETIYGKFTSLPGMQYGPIMDLPFTFKESR